jgi:hypothetical protein
LVKIHSASRLSLLCCNMSELTESIYNLK